MMHFNSVLMALKKIIVIHLWIFGVLFFIAVGQFAQVVKFQNQYIEFEMDKWSLGSTEKRELVTLFIDECLDKSEPENGLTLRNCADRVGAKELLVMLDDDLIPNVAWPLSIIVNKNRN